MSVIKFKRGLKASLPTLEVGEPGFTTDTKEFYIGSGTGNVQLGNMLKSTYDSDNDGIVDNAAALGGQNGSYYLDRTNHTGTQAASTISDFTEAAQDVVGAMVVDGTTIDFTYDDNANTLTAEVINGSIGTTKLADDAVTTAKIADGNVTFAKLAGAAVETSVETMTATDTAVPTSKAVKDVTDALDTRIADIETGTLNTEAVQDIIGSTLTDTDTIDFTYDDNAGTIVADVKDSSIVAAKIAANAVTAVKLNSDVAGAAVVLNGTTNALDVNVDGVGIEISSDALQLKDGGVATAKLADDSVTAAKVNADVAGAALVQNGGTGALDVNVDGTTIEVATDAIQVKDGGISTAKLADDSVTAAKVNADVAGLALVQNGTTGALDVNVDGSTIEVATDAIQVKDSGITSAKIADDAVTFGKVATADIETDLGVSASSSKLVTAAAAKAYADAVATGLAVHEPVRLTTTAELTATYDNGTSGVGATLTNSGTQAALELDSVAAVVGNRVLVRHQSAQLQNGIYEVTSIGSGSTNWVLTRTSDFDNSPTNEIHDGDFFFVGEGTLFGDNGFVQTQPDPITVGTNSIVFQQFSGAGQIVAGDGLSKTGNELDVNVDGTTLEINTDALRVKDSGISTAKIAANAVTAVKLNSDVAGAAIVLNGTTNAIDVNVDGSTIEVATDAIQVKDSGISTAKLADDSVTAAKVNADVAGAALVQNGGTGALDVNVDGVGIEISSDALQLKDSGVATSKIADDAVTAAKIAADVAGLALVQNGTTGALDVNVDGTTIEVATDAIQVKDSGISTAKLADDSVTAAKVNADVAGAALVQNGGTGALDVNVDGTTIEVATDAIQVKDGGITAAKIGANAVTAAKLNSNVAGVAVALNGTTNAIDVKYDNSSVKVNGSNELYVDLVDGGSF
jgi:ribosomal protein L25 (general stress protein Ctc)